MTSISARDVSGPLSRKIRELCGQNLSLCFQCGLCAGSCPMAGSMEVHTSRMMHMLQLGIADRAISSRMAERCTACHTCQVRCPRGLDVPRIVEALRLATLRAGTDLLTPERIPASAIRDLPQAAMVAGMRKLTA